MTEFIIFLLALGVIRALHRLTRAAPQPRQAIRIDIYHHFDPPGDGEELRLPGTQVPAGGKFTGGNVVVLRRGQPPSPHGKAAISAS